MPPEDDAAPGWRTEGSDQSNDQADSAIKPENTADDSGLYIEDAPPALISKLASQKWLNYEADNLVRQRRGSAGKPMDFGRLRDILARPQTEPFRMDGLMPWEANTLIVAQRKTGKTTIALNMARCLYTGEAFADAFPTQKITGNVALLNFEVSAGQIARWADDVDVPDRFLIFNARGARNPLLDAGDRQTLVQSLLKCEVESVIVDPFGRAFTGTSQNDSGEVSAWLAGLEQTLRGEAGVKDVILTAHAGWNGERSRGSSALEDWADSIITLTRNEDGQTFFRAMGRDVDVDEDLMSYDPGDRWLTLSGRGSRKDISGSDKTATLTEEIISLIRAQPGMTGVRISEILRAKRVPFQKGQQYKALNNAEKAGILTFHPSPNGGKAWSIAAGK